MHTRLLTSVFASLLAPALAACGDSGGGESSATITATVPMTSEETPTSTGGETPTTTGDDTTTTGGETPTTTVVDPTTGGGDSTTGEPMGCNAPADDGDADADGVLNSADNCRCDANPNQLDFDGNSVGNVCDAPLRYTLADGAPPEFNQLVTTATAEKTLSCSFPVNMIVAGGEVQLELDDAGVAKIYALKLNFVDTPELTCDLLLVKVKLRIEKWYSDGPDPFTVGFPFTVADHENGSISGMTDSPHPILVSGIINVTESSDPNLAPPGENPLMMVPGSFPTGLATATNAGQISLKFDDKNSIVFMQTTMSGINIKLTGLVGTLRLKQ